MCLSLHELVLVKDCCSIKWLMTSREMTAAHRVNMSRDHVTKGASVDAATCHDDVKSICFRSAPEGTTPLVEARDRRPAGWFVVVVYSRRPTAAQRAGLVNIDEVISQASRRTRSAVGRPFRLDITCSTSITVATTVARVGSRVDIVNTRHNDFEKVPASLPPYVHVSQQYHRL